MTITQLITCYHIALDMRCISANEAEPTGKLRVWDASKAKKNGDFEKIVAAKEEILAVLMSEYNAEEEKIKKNAEKIAAIQGLSELRAAYRDVEEWREEWYKSFENVGGFGVRPKPQYDFEAMREAYPRAAAYLDAEAYFSSANYAKSAAGKKALEAIKNGEDYTTALETMKKEWQDYCDEHIFD